MISICTFFSSSVESSDSILIALNVAESGIEVEGDEGIISGVRLAINVINANGGVHNRPLEIKIIDNHGTDIGARNSALTALKTEAIAMVGAGRSSRTLAAAKILQKNSMPLVTPYSTHPEITKIGDYIFRVGFTDDFQGRKLGEIAAAHLNARNVVIFENVSEKYSTTLAAHFSQRFKSLNGSIVWHGYYHRTSMDFLPLFEEIKNLNYDLIFIPGYSKRSAWIIKQAQKNGLKTRFLGGGGWGNSMFQFAGDYMEGQISVDHWHPDLPTPKNNLFLKRYKEEFGDNKPLSTGVALAYDSVFLIAQAIKGSNDASRNGVQNGLVNLKGYHGVTGLIEFNQYGDPVQKDLMITRFNNKRKELVGVLNAK